MSALDRAAAMSAGQQRPPSATDLELTTLLAGLVPPQPQVWESDPVWRVMPVADPDTAFGDTIRRLLVLYELKKCGALTYDEWTELKERLLGI